MNSEPVKVGETVDLQEIWKQKKTNSVFELKSVLDDKIFNFNFKLAKLKLQATSSFYFSCFLN